MRTLRKDLFIVSNFFLQPPEGEISWEHYRTLFKEDTQFSSSLRVCPKLTEAHVFTNNLMKMRVRLATQVRVFMQGNMQVQFSDISNQFLTEFSLLSQIFSNSVCDGLRYYKEKGIVALANATPTILFTKRMNDLFDLLNSKKKYAALTAGTALFDVSFC